MPIGNPSQSRIHKDRAERQLAEAREALGDTRRACPVAYRGLLRAHEALTAAWVHVGAMAENTPRDRRNKGELQRAHRDLWRAFKRDRTAFGDRCVLSDT